MFDFEGGWIPVPRAIQDTIVWKNQTLWRFWSWCYFQAEYMDTVAAVQYAEVKIRPGQLLISLRAAATGTGLTVDEVRTCIKKLAAGNDPFISATTENIPHRKTLITLLKFVGYEDDENANPTVLPHCSHSSPTVVPQQSHTAPTVQPQCSHTTPTLLPQSSPEIGDNVPPPSPHAHAPAKLVVEELKETHTPAAAASDGLLEIGREVLGLTCDFLLDSWVKRWPEDWIVQALWKCKAKNMRGGEASLYAQGVLRNWTNKGGPDNDRQEHQQRYQSHARNKPRFGQCDFTDILEDRRRGREAARGMGEPLPGFHRCSG